MRLPGFVRIRFRPVVGKDVGAGVVLGLVSVPDGLAAGLLAGVSPVAGLYGYLVGTFAGAVATSSVFMCVQATGAMAVIIADVPQVTDGPDAAAALATLGILTGLAMVLCGLLRLGSLVRFVPNAVLTGFVNAVAVTIVLSQLANFTGYDGSGPNRIVRAVNTLVHLAFFDWPTVATGTATLLLILALERTRLGSLGLFVAVAAASSIVLLIGWDGVTLVRDVAALPDGLPTPTLPSLSLVFTLLIPAVSLAFVGLVQGAAISQSVPNPDGTYPDVSGDFRGQGIANVASGLMSGTPVGGSMSATALVRAAGACSRLANLAAAVVMTAAILFFSDLTGYIAMPALAALLMLVGVRTLKLDQAATVWRTGKTQATVMVATFVLTLLIPLQYAVLVGVGLSVMLFVARQSNKVMVVRWTFREGEILPREVPPPDELPGREIIVLAVYGSLFFASAHTFKNQLPVVTSTSRGSVVVLRLRGKEDLGSTFIQAITRYARELEEAGSHLVLVGIGDRVHSQLDRTGALAAIGPHNVVRATPAIGESLREGIRRAHQLRGEPD
ncbi:SulP family inorganic anion transporter [Streptomyces wedmorensis]|uniref:SulP family inorganic anion transporter n=1 Tax=Streptomyces wedmorensis TaxID=43759 RepID=UPI0037AF967A